MLKTNDPQASKAERPVDPKRARLAALLKANADRADVSGECLHRRFEAQAARAPGAPAVTLEDQTLTYGELNARADRLARRLRALGVGPESLVGLHAERSIGLVVGLLAILKAGAAYLPLDPVHPPERLGFQLVDSGAQVLLAQKGLADGLPPHPARVVDLDDDAEAPEAAPGPLDGGATGENLAYVIYTSGSTGTPKGVPVTHANVVRLFASTRAWFPFDASDVWTLFHSFAFDFSVWEIWGALLHGGRLVVVPYWVARSPEAFRDLLRAERVTVLNQTPSAFRQLIRADEAAGPGELSLRFVIFGGEALELQALRPWFDRHGDATPRLVNMYGITETTVHVTYRPIARADLDTSAGASPIGRAIPDLRLYVLDRTMQPVPAGVVGEIYVGGAGLARGYLGRPGLTAERFVADPFSERAGARLYRSGDLARYRRDGELDYLGRADRQVKIRGFRVELGEIEAALARQPEIREAAVLDRVDARGETRLAAYLVPRVAPGPSAPEIRRRLKGALPDYMVPAAFVVLDAFPLTPNGKVDAAALPEPDWSGGGVGSEYVAPRTPAEAAIASAWGEVLGLGRVGAFDDFFALGGHSLLAAQVVSRLRQAFAADVPLRALFEAPTVAALAERVEALRLGGRSRASGPIVPSPRVGPAPASFSQQALWFLDRLAPGLPTFNVTAAVTVLGPLDAPALGRAYHEVVRRHEVLRTTFATVDGDPVQVIAPRSEPPFPTLDLTGLPEPDRAAEARRLASEEARRPFDLARGPLVRASLIRLGDREHAVLLTMHHIITDGWSMGVAARELAALYEAFASGEPSPLPEPAIQYADYAAWQRRWLAGDVLDELVAYWSGRLAGLRPLELPTDRPRPAARTSRGDARFFRIEADLAAAVADLGRREGATLFMTTLAAFKVLLRAYGGRDDVAVGVPVANRNRPEMEGLIGYFVNMLVLRTDLAGGPSFRDLLGRVREVALGAFEHQEMPFDKLVEVLQPPRDPSRTPLFDVMFVLQNNRMPDANRQDLTLGALDVGEGTGSAKFDLTLALEEADDGLVGSIEFNADLFDPATVDRMLDQFRRILEQVVADPDRPIADVALIDEAERDRMVVDWNRTAAELPDDARIHRLIEAQAARTPDAVALGFRGVEVSYRELNARANRLARFLEDRGVGPEVVVGLCAGRSVEMAVALLAILKAGGAFVPLDPAEPRARLAEIVDDSAAAVVLTLEAYRSHLPAGRAEVIGLDTLGAGLDRWSDRDLGSPTTADHAAYLIYTSGSTGRPRGVVVAHRSMVNHGLAAARRFGLGPGDRVLQFAPLSFDIAIEEIFPAWISGAAVILREDDAILDPVAFTDWIGRERITVLDLPTAYWHAWVDRLATGGRAPAAPLRLVVVGGERALASAYAAWRAIVGDRVRWLNTYGPTEGTVIATTFEPSPDRDGPDDPPIGRPIANARAYVLDGQLRPVPVGLPGELYIGGAGVARGYLGLPGATAERFVPDPFGDEPGARLFRTGDLARWRADGQLLFLGRRDHQAKIRGFRVEPGEVEAALLAHPAIAAAVVVARPGGDGGRLDAYVVPREGPAIGREEVVGFLRDRLPRHLIPATVTPLPALPLTAAGKVDRRSLPDPARVGADSAPGLAPRDEIEARLARIWADVLGVESVGVTAGFFDLGGHSLLAIRMLTRVEAEFGRTLSLASLFVGSSIADLAEQLREPAGPEAWSPLVTIQPGGSGPPFFCVHPAGGIVYCFLELARRLGADRPFHAFQAAGLAAGSEPVGSIGAMAASYIEALRAEQPEGPYHLGGWSLGGIVAFEMARQLAEQGQSVATLAIFDAHAPRPLAPGTHPLRDLAREAASLALFAVDDRPDSPGMAVDDVAVLLGLLAEMAPGAGWNPRKWMAHLRRLTPDQQRYQVLKLFRLDEVYHRETGPEQVRRLWLVLRTNLLAGARYVPSPCPGRLTLFRASQGRSPDPTLGWGEYIAVTTHVIPGDHASILRGPGVEDLARALRPAPG